MKYSLQSGFSLVELIVVVILLGILGSVGGLLIVQPIEAYEDQVRRQQLVDQGEMALRQIARDVRRALPNSLRINNNPFGTGQGWALEMVNTRDGARYRDEAGTGYDTTDEYWLEFVPLGDDRFNLLGGFQTIDAPAEPTTQLLDEGLRIVLYPTSTNDIYDDAAADTNTGMITSSDTRIRVTAFNDGLSNEETQIRLVDSSDIAVLHSFRDAVNGFYWRSPQQRLFLVDGPLSYVCNPTTGQITRYADYDYASTQPTPSSGLSSASSGLVVSQLADCGIIYDAGTSQRAGVLTVSIQIDDGGQGSGEEINLLHQIHVVNVP